MNRFLVIFCIFVVLFSLCSCELALQSSYGKPSYTKVNILVYGNDYKDHPEVIINGTSCTVSELNCTVNDAVQVGLAFEALAAKTDVECNATYVIGKNCIKNSSIESKIDHNTTKAHFRALMKNLASKAKASELTIIFFSCHGYNKGKVDKQEYGVESKTSFVMCGKSSPLERYVLYSQEDFKADLAAIPGTKVVFTDACYSGGLVEPSNVAINTDEYSNIDVFSLFWNHQDVSQSSNTFYLTACRYYEESYEPSSDNHGRFTSVLLQALGWDEENQKITGKSGALTFFDICQYVVKNNRSSSGQEQNPMLSSGSSDVILFYI